MQGDCLERMQEIPDGSIDMVLTDPPYGTTACKWDTVIDLPQMWEQLKRITKPNGAIVMTASQPFTSALVMSNPKMFKYDWIWRKNLPTGFGNARFMPMKNHESVLVFVRRQKPTFNKQPTQSLISDRAFGGTQKGQSISKPSVYGKFKKLNAPQKISKAVSPRSVLEINCVPRATGSLHPTQKPVALIEYLIRTYTNEGDTVLDFTMGSGTTGVACKNLGRDFIGIELDQGYFHIAKQRIEQATTTNGEAHGPSAG